MNESQNQSLNPSAGGTAMVGLTVRWSLAAAPDGTEDALRSYVADTSYARFTGMAGLRFKTWRCRPGEWFEGCYVFASDEERQAFQDQFTEAADKAPVSELAGSGPVLIEACEIVAVAEGWEGFQVSARGDRVTC